MNDPTGISLYLTQNMQLPMDDANKVTILNRTGPDPGSMPQAPRSLQRLLRLAVANRSMVFASFLLSEFGLGVVRG